MSNSLQPHGLSPTRLICPWNSPGQNTGVGSLSLLQGIFPTQGSQRQVHILNMYAIYLFLYVRNWRRKWQPTPVFLPGESHGRISLGGCSPWGHTESDTTEETWHHRLLQDHAEHLIPKKRNSRRHRSAEKTTEHIRHCHPPHKEPDGGIDND